MKNVLKDIGDTFINAEKKIIKLDLTANNTNKSDKNKLQDKIDELAEKDVIPNLSKGIVKKTQTVDRSNNVINFAFSLAIVGVPWTSIRTVTEGCGPKT